MQPENSVTLTTHILQKLKGFIESDEVQKLRYFCDYDKQALADAVYYLNEYVKLVQIMDRARKNAYMAEDEDEDRPRFKMDSRKFDKN